MSGCKYSTFLSLISLSENDTRRQIYPFGLSLLAITSCSNLLQLVSNLLVTPS